MKQNKAKQNKNLSFGPLYDREKKWTEHVLGVRWELPQWKEGKRWTLTEGM